MKRYAPEDVDLHMILNRVNERFRWVPDWDLHKTIVNRDGIRFFTLDPFSITQVVYRDAATHDLIKTNWFYVDAGCDGHCVLGLDNARIVLNDTMILYSKLCIEKFNKENRR